MKKGVAPFKYGAEFPISSLFLFHTDANTGYAIGPLENLFYGIGLEFAAGNPSLVHFGYKRLDTGHPRSLPAEFRNLITYDYFDRDPLNIRRLKNYVHQNHIRLVVIFDIQPVEPLFRALPRRRCGGDHQLLGSTNFFAHAKMVAYFEKASSEALTV
jgi:hypothetical protein